jgi:hypothetical protein
MTLGTELGLSFTVYCIRRFCTRERFMKNVVNLVSFTHYPQVIEMLQDVENLFKAIQSRTHIPHSSEEQLFIDAMRR